MTANGNTLGDAIETSFSDVEFYTPSSRQKGRNRKLAEALLAQMVRRASLTVNAEAANVITVDVQIADGGDTSVSAVTTCVAWLYDDNMAEAAPAAFTVAETGAGAEVSTTAKGGLIFTTDANGVAELSVTDVAGASGATMRLVVEVVTGSGLAQGQRSLGEITFD